MNPFWTTNSPMKSKADAFLGDALFSKTLKSQSRGNGNFHKILNRKLNPTQHNRISSFGLNGKKVSLNTKLVLGKLRDQLEGLGLPLEKLPKNREGIMRLGRILKNSGMNDNTILAFMNMLASGDLNKILNQISGGSNQKPNVPIHRPNTATHRQSAPIQRPNAPVQNLLANFGLAGKNISLDRESALEDLKSHLADLGLPLESLPKGRKGLIHLGKMLRDRGMDENTIRSLFSKIAGPGTNKILNQKLSGSKNNQASQLGLAVKNAPSKRHSALEELNNQLDSLSLPLEGLTMNRESIIRLGEILQDSGMDEKSIQTFMDKLAVGNLNMNRVRALLSSIRVTAPPVLKPANPPAVKHADQPAVKPGDQPAVKRDDVPSVKSSVRPLMKFGDTSAPFMGKFLAELGFPPDQASDIISKFQPGQTITAEKLQEVILQNTDINLKDVDLSRTDQTNLKNLLLSMGMKESDTDKLTEAIQTKKGNFSLENFIDFIKSTSRPHVLTADAEARIKEFIESLQLKHSLKIQPKFNRTITLMQSIGEGAETVDLSKNSPAIEILRNGSMSAKALINPNPQNNTAQQQAAPAQAVTEVLFDTKAAQPFASADQNSVAASASGSETSLGAETSGEERFANLDGAASRNRLGGLSQRAETIYRQVAEKILYSVRNNQHRIKLQLMPKELGKVTIDLIYKNHSLVARIITESGLAKEALDKQVEQLKKTLADQGLNLEKFDVYVQTSGRNSSNQARGDRGFSLGKSSPNARPDEPDEIEPAIINAVREKSRVDLFT